MENRFGGFNPDDAIFQSMEVFMEAMLDDEQFELDWRHLQCLNFRLNTPTATIRRTLEAMGFIIRAREKEKAIRTFSSNSHNLWSHPDMKCHGGSGGASIVGMAKMQLGDSFCN